MPQTGKIRFGPFELDAKAGELRKSGRRIRLQDKPLRLLVALLEQRGEVVTREELRERLWPGNIVVEFDNGLNNAANKLRAALADSANEPKYIETVGRRGYRFVGAVTADEPAVQPRRPQRRRRRSSLRRRPPPPKCYPPLRCRPLRPVRCRPRSPSRCRRRPRHPRRAARPRAGDGRSASAPSCSSRPPWRY